MSDRKVIDCRKYPSDKGCTLTIAGTEEEVLQAAVKHAIEVHGHKDSPELKSQLRTMLADE